jgi:hypothetical protein
MQPVIFQLELAPAVTLESVLCIARLKKLKELRFEAERTDKIKCSDLPCLFIENMPWIQCIVDEENNVFEGNSSLKKVISYWEHCGEFQLRTFFAKNRLPPRASFPNLQHLYLCGPLLDDPSCIKSFASLSKLSRLIVENVKNPDLYQILKLVGHGLESLTIFGYYAQIESDLLLNYCPNLETIRIKNVDGVTFHPRSAKFFHRLKSFSLKLSPEIFISSEFLRCVLEAPNVEKISLSSVTLETEDLEMIMNLDQSKLRHLKSLTIDFLEYAGRDSDNNLAALVKCIISKSPNLVWFVIHAIGLNEIDLHQWKRRDVQYFLALMKHLNC